jgi:hypothetical protein
MAIANQVRKVSTLVEASGCMPMKAIRRLCEVAFCIYALSFFSSSAFADELAYGIEVGAIYSDNVARLEEKDSGEETIGLVGFNVDYSSESRGLETDILVDLQYHEYLDGSFDGEPFGAANADLKFILVPNLLNWQFQDRFGVINSDPLQASTPENREVMNVFSTGPELSLAIGKRTTVGLSATYRNTRFEESDSNSDALGGWLSLSRAVSPNRSLSLNLSAARVEFESELNSDFDRQAAYVGFNSRNSRGSIQVDVGYNELHDQGEVLDGTFFSINWSRKLSSRVGMTLGYNQRYSDTANIFGDFQNPGLGFGDTRNVSSLSEAFEFSRVSIGFDYSQDKTKAYIRISADEYDYVSSSSLNRSYDGIRVGVSRDFAGSWSASLDADYRRSVFDDQSREDDDKYLRGKISKRISRNLKLNLAYSLSDRSSDQSGRDYSENRLSLTISYDQ